VKRRIRNSVNDGQTLAGTDIDSDHNLLVTKVCTSLKKIVRFQMRRQHWDLEEIYIQKQKVQDTQEEKLGATDVTVGLSK